MTQGEDSKKETPTKKLRRNGSTDSPQRRWQYTNDIIAGWLVGTFPLMIAFDAYGAISLRDTPETAVMGYVVLVGTAVTWAFGSGALEAWRNGK